MRILSPSWSILLLTACGTSALPSAPEPPEDAAAASDSTSTDAGVPDQSTPGVDASKPGSAFYSDTSGSSFDVADDGTLFVLRYRSAKFEGKCVAANGTVIRDWFAIAAPQANHDIEENFGQVRLARTSKRAVVTWLERNYMSQTPDDARSLWVRRFDATCQPSAPPAPFFGGEGPTYVHDAAVDPAGNFALAWSASLANPTASGSPMYVSFYDVNGVKQGADRVVDSTNKCGQNHGIHVALNATGAGIVTCQSGSTTHEVRYRRFDAQHAFIEPLTEVVATKGHSSANESHVVGIDDDGSFAVEWEDGVDMVMRASLFDQKGGLITSIALGADTGAGVDAFRYMAQSVPILDGDYLFRGSSTSASTNVDIWRVGKSGSAKSHTTTGFDTTTLRARGPSTWIFDAKGVARNVLAL